MQQAIFINGVYEKVLKEIIEAQRSNTDLICYLQPYSSKTIKVLAERPPNKKTPIILYISTTGTLDKVCYIADIVGWEKKQSITPTRLELLNNHIRKFQPGEKNIYMTVANGKDCVNLISILDLKQLPNPFSVSNLEKVNDNKSLKVRTRAGNWSYVYKLPNWIGTKETIIKERFDLELENSVKDARETNDEIRKNRLFTAPRHPEQVQVVSLAYKRNPDVIAEVLKRANGKCDHCKSDAPFLRAKDNSPYLETHHWIPLSEEGEDTVENAGALCPNCHRELHFGKQTETSRKI